MADSPGLVICGGRSRNWDYCVAATYERSSGTTSCIVQGLETDEIEVLKESIRASQCSFPNPLLIPILLIGLKASRFVAVIEHRARALESLELETGMKYGFSVDPRRNISREALKAKAGLLDFDLITQKLTCIIGTLAFCELTFTASLKALDLLSLFDDKLPASIPREILQQRVLFLRNLVEGVQLNRALLLQRTQAQVQTVCLLPRHALPSTERIDMHYLTSELTSDIWQVFSLIGQKDNRVNIETATSSHRLAEASLKESAAMKEIAEESRNLAFLTQRGNIDMRINAAVTLIFLPGTFIATFFSTSFFDFQSRNDVVSGWIWLYFLFTVVLTMLVLGSWSFGSRRQNQRMERLRNEQREKEKSIEMQS
ncbi:uncharacterized protein KY384_000381 [Bacidia gigantensis]|uniref:uncharacterized protein n=1 Tax=Bacidia gigantensis TaxID=2732470 RepID=UPI001D03B282|nr:uncharacterized protein KY384_000381 [Bacidia gigantensis]KAG8526387.1 hypothetical protein KY384_000381 [Bacidia gigantensis]